METSVKEQRNLRLRLNAEEREAVRAVMQGLVNSTEIASLYRTSEAQRTEIKKLEEKRLKLESQVASLSDVLTTEKQFQERTVKDKGSQVSELEGQLRQLQGELARVRAELRDSSAENDSLKEDLDIAESQLQASASEFQHLEASLERIVPAVPLQVGGWLKQYLRTYKASNAPVDFLNLLGTYYDKLVERLSPGQPVQVFSLARVTIDKYLLQVRASPSKSAILSRHFEKSSLMIEKEFGIERATETKSKETLKEKLKTAEKQHREAVRGAMDHILLIVELQSDIEKAMASQVTTGFMQGRTERKSASAIPIVQMTKDILRNSDIDKEGVFYEFSALKVLELGQLQTSYETDSRALQVVAERLHGLESMLHASTSLAVMLSSLYTCLLNKSIFQEWQLSDRNQLIQSLVGMLTLKELKIREVTVRSSQNALRTVKEEKSRLEQAAKLKKLTAAEQERAAMVIQRFFRSRQKSQMKRRAYIAEFKFQRSEEQTREMREQLSQMNSRTGQILLSSSFKDISIVMSGLFRQFTK